jgi:hypothetical protein
MYIPKIVSSLPEERHFTFFKFDRDRYIWRDRLTDTVCIEVPTKNPWDEEWIIMTTVVFSGSKSSPDPVKYPRRVRFRCSPFEKENSKNAILANIVRQEFKGKFAFTESPNLFHMAFQEDNALRFNSETKTRP